MDINFHYFTVKTLALAAGFIEEDAQILAEYSQFIDDYDIWKNYVFEEVPEYAMCLAEKKKYGYKFYTVTTGFDGVLDSARLSIEKYQREVVVPFHFIPIKPLKDISKDDRSQYRTSPADITGTFLIKDLITEAKEEYIEHQGRYELMKIGMLLHTFADTYAHQNYSGFHGWENFSYLKKATDNYLEDRDITKEYKPDFYYKIYSVGHANTGHAPDDTYASFEMSMAENKEQKDKKDFTLKFSRSNTQIFCDAAKQIFKYLYLCQQKAEPGEEEWEAVKSSLIRGFALHSKDAEELALGWKDICPNNEYHYSSAELWQDLLIPSENVLLLEAEEADMENGSLEQKSLMSTQYKTAHEDFFRYNVFAKEIRDRVIE